MLAVLVSALFAVLAALAFVPAVGKGKDLGKFTNRIQYLVCIGLNCLFTLILIFVSIFTGETPAGLWILIAQIVVGIAYLVVLSVLCKKNDKTATTTHAETTAAE